MGRILKRASVESSRTPGEIPAEASRGEALLAAARVEAAAILEAARLEADGTRAAERERLRAELAVEWGEARAQREEEIVSLALAVAEKVLVVAVEDPRAARETARRALRSVGGQGAAVLRCHPADEHGLRDALGELLPVGPVSAVPELRPDPSVGRGGAIVDTDAGTIDARIEQQLRVVARCLGAVE